MNYKITYSSDGRICSDIRLSTHIDYDEFDKYKFEKQFNKYLSDLSDLFEDMKGCEKDA